MSRARRGKEGRRGMERPPRQQPSQLPDSAPLPDLRLSIPSLFLPPPLRNLTSSSRPPSLHSLFLWNFVPLSGWSSSTRHPPSSSLFDALIPVSLRVYLPRPYLWALISLYTLEPWLQRTPRTVHASLPRTSTTRTSTPTHPTRIPRTVATTPAPPRSTATPLQNTNTSPTSHLRRSTAMVTGEPV